MKTDIKTTEKALPEPERKYVVPVKGILTSVPEGKLTLEDFRFLFNRLLTQVNESPLQCRAWLAQAILEQHGITVTAPGQAVPQVKKKERNKIKKIIVSDE